MGNRKTGEDVMFDRLRRITGYLVGTVDRWNDAKKAELGDRVKHAVRKETNTDEKILGLDSR